MMKKFRLDGKINDVNEVLWEIMENLKSVDSVPVEIELDEDDLLTIDDLKESCEDNHVTFVELP